MYKIAIQLKDDKMNVINRLLGFLMMLLPVLTHAQEKISIVQLFDSLKVNPVSVSSQIAADKTLQYKKIATGTLWPDVYAFGKYDYSDSPNGMLPVPPNELIMMVQNPLVAQPFSENILRGGVHVSMPLFVKSIYSMVAKAQIMYEAATLKAEIDLQKNEAIIVGANANFVYIQNLEKAIQSKRKSLEKMQELVQVKVNNGRAPESALLLLNTNINELELNLAQLQMNKEKVRATIYTLTNVQLDSAVSLTKNAEFQNGDFVVLKPMEKMIDAQRLNARAEQEKLYPALFAQANYVHNNGKSYNNNQTVNNDFTTAGLTLKIPIFQKSQYSKIKLGNIEVKEKENELEKMRMEITAEAGQLSKSLTILNHSIDLNRSSIQSKQQLLDIAKKSYSMDRLTIEDYLKYEDDLLFEKAKLYQTQAEKWQTLMKLAVIYGNNIENLVK